MQNCLTCASSGHTQKPRHTFNVAGAFGILLRRLTQARVFLLPFIPGSRIEEHRPGWDTVAHTIQPGCTQRNRLVALIHSEVMRLLTNSLRTSRQGSKPSPAHLARVSILNSEDRRALHERHIAEICNARKGCPGKLRACLEDCISEPSKLLKHNPVEVGISAESRRAEPGIPLKDSLTELCSLRKIRPEEVRITAKGRSAKPHIRRKRNIAEVRVPSKRSLMEFRISVEGRIREARIMVKRRTGKVRVPTERRTREVGTRKARPVEAHRPSERHPTEADIRRECRLAKVGILREGGLIEVRVLREVHLIACPRKRNKRRPAERGVAVEPRPTKILVLREGRPAKVRRARKAYVAEHCGLLGGYTGKARGPAEQRLGEHRRAVEDRRGEVRFIVERGGGEYCLSAEGDRREAGYARGVQA